ncbi:L-selectin-like [Sinocyclocheilus grahami]|uniref:L-selectin-like n=1 Tax=Sinocyclocheilus grahami TaxID=75366 RepID=UPI0007ACEB1F|nr:PREDICTED: L-selectin-like [Sinocyclocheilus grahami]
MWDSSQPDLYHTIEACGAVHSNGRWGDRYCTTQDNFFCQTDNQDTLQAKFQHIETSMTWTNAQLYCRTHYVDLATITDNTENDFLANILSSLNLNDAWIGLYKIPWLWSDKSSVSWSSVKWEFGQPDNVKGNENCARANNEGLMADDTCSTRLPFYCRENRKIKHVRFTVKSDGHLDESAVMEAIEKKMKQILSDQHMKIRSSIHERQ